MTVNQLSRCLHAPQGRQRTIRPNGQPGEKRKEKYGESMLHEGKLFFPQR
jgi:hypothetical protein